MTARRCILAAIAACAVLVASVGDADAKRRKKVVKVRPVQQIAVMSASGVKSAVSACGARIYMGWNADTAAPIGFKPWAWKYDTKKITPETCRRLMEDMKRGRFDSYGILIPTWRT